MAPRNSCSPLRSSAGQRILPQKAKKNSPLTVALPVSSSEMKVMILVMVMIFSHHQLIPLRVLTVVTKITSNRFIC